MIRCDRKRWLGAAALAALLIAGCNPATDPGTGDLKEGALTADFASGDGFTSSGAQARIVGNTVAIQATQDLLIGTQDEIVVVVPIQTGSSYTVSTSSNPSAKLTYCRLVGTSCSTYLAQSSPITVGDGTISVTSITRDGSGNPLTLKGTFSGRLIQRGSADSVRTITNGQFNVRVD